MPYSAWPLRYKILALVLLAVSVGAAGLAASWFFNALPNEILFPLVSAIFAGAVGFLLGHRSATREFEKRWDADAPPGGF
jgi:hypothetical protein